MKANFLAGEIHFVEHLASVYKSLSSDKRGVFYVRNAETFAQAVKYRLSPKYWSGRIFPKSVVVCCSLGDLNQAWKAGATSILMEHGAGQTYNSNHGSYAGGAHPARNDCSMFLVPGVTPAKKLRSVHDVPVYEIGCPKLDKYILNPPEKKNVKPKVFLSFHWDCRVAPETRWVWHHYRRYIKSLVGREEYDLYGHCHPRAQVRLQGWYQSLDIPFVKSFDEVLQTADCYIVDNSSTLFEAAAVNIPVVVLNSPEYRKNVSHGLRFWDVANIGPQVDAPRDLHNKILESLNPTEDQQKETERCLDVVYSVRDGSSSQLAANYIERFLCEL